MLSDKKSKGLTILVLVNLIWIVGMVMSEFEAGSRVFHPWLFYPAAGCGGTVIVSFFDPAAKHLLYGLQSVREYQDVPQWGDTGVLMVCVAGLLNVLCLLDVIDSRLNPNREDSSNSTAKAKS